ncbi:MAG: MOSC domain-containing protein [Acidimicrobiales bacterium]
MSAGVVSAIHLHPIKSCHRVEVIHATVASTGLDGDRRWQVIGDGTVLTQRRHPGLATVRPEPVPGGLSITAPGHGTLTVADPDPGATPASVPVLAGVPAVAGDAGDEAGTWVSAVLGVNVRLVGLAAGAGITLPEPFNVFSGQAIAFGDLAPLLVAGTASAAWLADRATEPFGVERFRANVVVATDQPFVEDTWDRFGIGAASATQVVPWPRCAVPQVDQETGTRHREPALVLKAHRWCDDASAAPPALRPILEGAGLFGVACSVGPPGTVIRVGDPVDVATTRPPLIPAPGH